MKKLVILFLLSISIITPSCGVRDDGALSYKGKIYKMFYFSTKKDLETIKNGLIEKFGDPTYIENDKNRLTFNNCNIKKIKDITIVIFFTRTSEWRKNPNGSISPILVDQSVGFAFVDNYGNDLLKGTSKSIIKKYLKELIEEFSMR